MNETGCFRKRLSADECLQHSWMTQCDMSMSCVKLSTDKLKKFIIRRKWQVKSIHYYYIFVILFNFLMLIYKLLWFPSYISCRKLYLSISISCIIFYGCKNAESADKQLLLFLFHEHFFIFKLVRQQFMKIFYKQTKLIVC